MHIKVGIIGIGVLGTAMSKSFLEKNINIILYDKFKNIGSFEGMLDADIIFLCLPTTYDIDSRQYDKTSIFETCGKLKDNKYNGIVVIKSTVEPLTSQTIADKYCLNIFHNPEFLTARTSYEDFHNQSHIIVGKTSQITDNLRETLVDFFHLYYPIAKISECSSSESESVKLFCNNFYAVKVQFFTELYLLCQKMGVNYDIIRDMMLQNNWINPMHTSVPGPDKSISYGGMCFPKDTNALSSFMKFMEVPHGLIDATINERNSMRDD